MSSLVNEANSDFTHREMIDHLTRCFEDHDWVVYQEFELPEGLRADLLCQRPDHDIVIVECKADFRPREVSRAVLKYSPWCHWLMLALNMGDAKLMQAASTGFYRLAGPGAYGLIGVDRFGYTTYVVPQRRLVPPVRRILLDGKMKARIIG
jgi:hypothetical protein